MNFRVGVTHFSEKLIGTANFTTPILRVVTAFSLCSFHFFLVLQRLIPIFNIKINNVMNREYLASKITLPIS